MKKFCCLLGCLLTAACGSGGGAVAPAAVAAAGASFGGADPGSSGASGGGLGGMGGSAGQMLPVKLVGKCDGLAPIGTWENVTPPGDLGDAIGINIDPFATGGLFVGMHKGGNGGHAPTDGLYKSTDCGSTWSPQLNKGANGDMAAQGSWTSLVVDPITPNVVYVAPIYGAGGVWKSIDGGVNWTQLFPPDSPIGKVVQYNFFDNISIDPTNHLHLLAGTHADCEAPYGPACLAETKDGGATWTFVKLPIPAWGENAGPWIINDTTWLYAGGGIFLTTDNGVTFTGNIAPVEANFYSGGEEQIHPMPHSADGAYYLASAEGVVKSADGGHTWSLLPNSPTPSFGLVIGGDTLFSTHKAIYAAKLSNLSTWTEIPKPANLAADQVCFYADYDEGHHLLYISCYGAGVWRTVTQ